MTQTLYFILLIGPLIFIHELGHLLAAKLVDVKARRFSIGFGPPIFRVQLGETEYCIAPIPLGGYVNLLGQNPYEEIPEADADRSLHTKPLWARYLVLGAGPAANLILPVIIYFFFFLGQTVQSPPIIGTVLDDSAAQAAELQAGDRIVALDDETTQSWSEMTRVISDSPDVELKMTIERNGQRFDRFVSPKPIYRNNQRKPIGRLGVLSTFYAPQIGLSDTDSPLYKQGLRTGDIITSVNGEPLGTVEELESLIKTASDDVMRMTYLRASRVEGPLATYLTYASHHVRITPTPNSMPHEGLRPANTFVRNVEIGSPAETAGLRAGDQILEIDGLAISRAETIGTIAYRKREQPFTLLVRSVDDAPREVSVTQSFRSISGYDPKAKQLWFGADFFQNTWVPPKEHIRGRFSFAAQRAMQRTSDDIFKILGALRGLATWEGLSNVTSVIGFFHYAGVAAEIGPSALIAMMAMVSLNLGILNLLPVPILDGGHIFIYTIEAIRRRPLGQRAREIISAVGLVLILLMMLLAFRNDTVNHILN